MERRNARGRRLARLQVDGPELQMLGAEPNARGLQQQYSHLEAHLAQSHVGALLGAKGHYRSMSTLRWLSRQPLRLSSWGLREEVHYLPRPRAPYQMSRAQFTKTWKGRSAASSFRALCTGQRKECYRTSYKYSRHWRRQRAAPYDENAIPGPGGSLLTRTLAATAMLSNGVMGRCLQPRLDGLQR